MESNQFVEKLDSDDTKDKAKKPYTFHSIIIVILLILVIVLVIALSIVASEDCNCKQKQQQQQRDVNNNTQQEKVISDNDFTSCKHDSVTIDPTHIEPTDIFRPLSENEINQIITYVEKNFMIYKYENRTSLDKYHFIYNIDLYIPDKEISLKFLDEDGQMPVRYAVVSIIQGIYNYLYLMETKPSSHIMLKLNDRPNPIIRHPAKSGIFKFDVIKEIISQSLNELWPLFKATYEEYETFDQPDSDLIAEDGYQPISEDNWIVFVIYWRNPSKSGIHQGSIDRISLLVNVTSFNESDWGINSVIYNLMSYKDISTLMKEFNTGKLNIVKVPKLSIEDMTRSSSMKRKGERKNHFKLREPITVSPQGPRFSIKGGRITYFDWEFNYLIRTVEGLGLFDVRHQGRRLAYEISLQEAASYYSTGNPELGSIPLLDSYWYLGKSISVLPGVDCPKHAVYVDLTYYKYGLLQTVDKALCIFEQNPSVPLRRHHHKTGKDKYKYGAMNDNSLVVRHMIEMWNYDYVIDYVMHQNGVIEVRTVTTGFPVVSPYYPQNGDKFGYEVVKNFLGGMHDHIMLYKVDLDIFGEKNSFKTIDLVTDTYIDAWDQQPLVKKFLIHNQKSTEKEARIRYNFDKPKYYVIYNKKVNNSFGNARGYRISMPYKVKQVYPDDHPYTKLIDWSKYQVSITKYKDSEKYGGCPLNYNPSYWNPPCRFDRRFDDNENIDQEDLVAWVPIGGLHIVPVEDFPITGTVGNQFTFFIKPFNYFEYDPSFSSPDSVYVEQNDKDIYVEQNEAENKIKCGIPENELF